MKEKVGWVLLGIMLAIVPALLLMRGGGFPTAQPQALEVSGYLQQLEQTLSNGLPMHDTVRQLGLRLGLLGGRQERNDIFFTENGLIRNIPAADMATVQRNVDAILQFAEQGEVPTYLTLIPTASAILQQQLPPYAELRNNQKRLMEDIYYQVTGRVTVMDVYPVLFSQRDKYIYYRTEDNLTALGGYYVYSVLGSKLVVQDVHSLDQFSIAYLDKPYYGELFRQSPYQGVRPDTLSYFSYTRHNREFAITHVDEESTRVYHSLYPLHLAELGQMMDTYFGGLSPIVHMRISSPYSRSLLVFGDKTALTWLPLMANNYQQITLVDLSALSAELAQSIDLQSYDQVLFAYSVETLDTDIPSRVLQLLP